MCSYCGCESEGVVAELMAEHEELSLLVRQAESALRAGDRARSVTLCAEVAARFGDHAKKEEEGLFRQLLHEELAQDSVARLEAEHRRLESGLARLASGDLTAMEPVFDLLLDHATREDTDLFPAALMLLSSTAWTRINPVGAAAGRSPKTVNSSERS